MYQEAERIHLKNKDLNAYYPDVYIRLAELYFMQGKLEKAESLYSQACEKFPNNPWTNNYAGLYYLRLRRFD